MRQTMTRNENGRGRGWGGERCCLRSRGLGFRVWNISNGNSNAQDMQNEMEAGIVGGVSSECRVENGISSIAQSIPLQS